MCKRNEAQKKRNEKMKKLFLIVFTANVFDFAIAAYMLNLI
jgi:hypothetical protein